MRCPQGKLGVKGVAPILGHIRQEGRVERGGRSFVGREAARLGSLENEHPFYRRSLFIHFKRVHHFLKNRCGLYIRMIRMEGQRKGFITNDKQDDAFFITWQFRKLKSTCHVVIRLYKGRILALPNDCFLPPIASLLDFLITNAEA